MAFLILGTISASCATNMTGGWSGSNATNYTATAGPVNVTANVTTTGNSAWTNVTNGTTNTTNYYSNSSAANHISLQASYWWDVNNETGSTDIDQPGDDKGTGYITFTFSRPVTNPVLHIDRIGGTGNFTSNSALFTLLTSGLTLSKLSGVDHFNVNSTSIWRTPDVPTATEKEANWDSTQGTASGSVMIIGTNISSVTFSWTGIGVEGAGADGIEMIWEIDPSMDLAITQSAAPTPAVAGQNLTYTITVTNNGNLTLLPTDTFTVRDTIPSGFTASSFTPSAGTYNNVTGAWTGVSLAPGQNITLTIVGMVSPTATGSLTNLANVTVPNGITDPVSVNNNTTLTTLVNRIADLSITKTDSPDPVVAGQTLTYTITVKNNGPSTILSSDIFKVNDQLPSSFTASSFIPSAGIYNNVTGAWTGVTMANGQNVTLTIIGTVSSTATGNLTNVANVTPPTGVIDNNTTNDQTPPIITTVDGLPVANNDVKTTPEDTPLSGNLPASDPDGPIALVNFMINGTTYAPGTKVNIPGIGDIQIDSEGNYTFTPAANYNGPVPMITYTVSDLTGHEASGTLTITVTGVNDAPVAVNDAVTTPEDTPIVVPVLGNDTDVDGDTLSVTGVTQPVHGVVSLVGGVVTYTPNANFNGVDQFTYTISDGHGGTSTANVTVTVTGVNDAPIARNDTVTVAEGTPLIINVLNNDSDVDGDVLSVVSTSHPAHGTVTVNANGTITYAPFDNYSGLDQFTYTISDGHGGTSTATVYVTVDNASQAIDDTVFVSKNRTVTGSVAGNDHQVNGDVFHLVSGPKHGSLSFRADGTYTYIPDPTFTGVDNFVYSIVDPSGHVSTATVSITVNGSDPSDPNSTTIHAASVPMQHTGMPLLWALLAIFMIAGGLLKGKIN